MTLNKCQVQAQYQYDMILHSVMPATEEAALANLQPVPGAIEYASGSPACFYKQHQIYSTKTGKMYTQWYRCNCLTVFTVMCVCVTFTRLSLLSKT